MTAVACDVPPPPKDYLLSLLLADPRPARRRAKRERGGVTAEVGMAAVGRGEGSPRQSRERTEASPATSNSGT
jgi:hypothetical protein